MEDHAGTPRRFADLLKRIVRVPKREIDEQEARYQRERGKKNPTKAGQIVPTDKPHHA